MMELDYDVLVVSAPTDDGWYGVQEKGFGGDKAGLGYLNFQPPFGFVSRPLDATIETDGTPVGCTQFIARLGRAGGFSWLGHDPRYTDKCPPVTRGSSAQWNAKGAYVLLEHEDDTCKINIPATGGGNYVLTMGKNGSGEQVISLEHANSATLIKMTATQVTITSPTVHVNSPNVLLGSAPGKQVACVGDLVSVVVPMLNCVSLGAPVVPVPPTAVTTTGGTMAIGQIISGRSGCRAGP
jgi:hypothetical protein